MFLMDLWVRRRRDENEGRKRTGKERRAIARKKAEEEEKERDEHCVKQRLGRGREKRKRQMEKKRQQCPICQWRVEYRLRRKVTRQFFLNQAQREIQNRRRMYKTGMPRLLQTLQTVREDRVMNVRINPYKETRVRKTVIVPSKGVNKKRPRDLIDLVNKRAARIEEEKVKKIDLFQDAVETLSNEEIFSDAEGMNVGDVDGRPNENKEEEAAKQWRVHSLRNQRKNKKLAERRKRRQRQRSEMEQIRRESRRKREKEAEEERREMEEKHLQGDEIPEMEQMGSQQDMREEKEMKKEKPKKESSFRGRIRRFFQLFQCGRKNSSS